jgi:hypothetical protein
MTYRWEIYPRVGHWGSDEDDLTAGIRTLPAAYTDRIEDDLDPNYEWIQTSDMGSAVCDKQFPGEGVYA